ncbi:MAG: 4Fe-4S binding protein [Firmicutes bacterium]|nr:4Fe-4S binding protein [Bacillota bacterium]MCL5038684.1 4Fe-4S binding protein [Bacillota bacterium]
MERVVFDEERCKGCELCTAVCPQKIVHMSDRFNSKGYRVATVTDQEMCTSCTLCARTCPDVVISVYR